MKIEKKCVICGANQKKDKEKNNHNWDYCDNKEKCKCGGNLGMYLDDKLIGGDKK